MTLSATDNEFRAAGGAARLPKTSHSAVSTGSSRTRFYSKQSLAETASVSPTVDPDLTPGHRDPVQAVTGLRVREERGGGGSGIGIRLASLSSGSPSSQDCWTHAPRLGFRLGAVVSPLFRGGLTLTCSAHEPNVTNSICFGAKPVRARLR